eukprot:TRINITY_DN20123_c0_g1_i2.p1 TRINITY_DN20123_c0_g1~~TRINITY_DN20123_c0_g1_i2.p1  ORF type:complete len:421 (+),score=75.85 TRINITY_DN20123_c0_g1_i2:66-1265(+)
MPRRRLAAGAAAAAAAGAAVLSGGTRFTQPPAQPLPEARAAPAQESGCEYPTERLLSEALLPEQLAERLRANITEEAKRWGYLSAFSPWAEVVRGKRVLDVGMGQGPVGVAMLRLGAESYVGVDPALCPARPALTRYRLMPRTRREGRIRRGLCKSAGCAAGKYRIFPYSGADMMRAWQGRLLLLRGTFETHATALAGRVFDVVTLNAVTEHLRDPAGVIAALWRTLASSPGVVLEAVHPSFYGWDGHHHWPSTPLDLRGLKTPLPELADWGHLERGSSVHNDTNQNRVRPGDLAALVGEYFECPQCPAAETVERAGVRPRLTPQLLGRLRKRGFRRSELLGSWVHFRGCRRRPAPLSGGAALQRLVFYHPPMDGTYSATPFDCGTSPGGAWPRAASVG